MSDEPCTFFAYTVNKYVLKYTVLDSEYTRQHKFMCCLGTEINVTVALALFGTELNVIITIIYQDPYY